MHWKSVLDAWLVRRNPVEHRQAYVHTQICASCGNVVPLDQHKELSDKHILVCKVEPGLQTKTHLCIRSHFGSRSCLLPLLTRS